jgi:hypothetical protein
MMQKKQTPFQFEIPRRGRHCTAAQEELIPDMDYYSLLIEVPEQGGYVREDFCAACWEKADKQRGKVSWKAKVPTKKTADTIVDLKREEKAMLLFRETLAQGEAGDAVRLFVLALYLARRKLLVLRQQVVEQGHTYFLYEVTSNEEMIYIQKIDLTKMRLRITEIQQSLAEQLSG